MKILPLPLIFAVSLWAADFWQSKPYTEWTDKEIQKILSNSPWSKEVVVSLSGGGGGSGKGSRKGGGGGGGGDTGFDGPATGSGGGNAGPSSRANVNEVGGGTPGGGTPGMTLVVSWRTALPLRQAIAKQKFGAEAGTSPEAKKVIEEPQKTLRDRSGRTPRPHGPRRRGDEGSAVEEYFAQHQRQGAHRPGGSPIQRHCGDFHVPETVAIDLDDKEVEFSTKLGQTMVKAKFKLKDMVFNGKLDL